MTFHSPPLAEQEKKMLPGLRRRPARRGYALVLVTMLLFGLMGLAALVMNVGFPRLAQSEMQTAVDSAALEGLRNGRPQASQIVSELFSDSTDANGQTVQYGAGPVVNFSGGVGDPDLAAAQLMQTGNPPVYQPGELQVNEGNAAEGDVVAGTYGVNPGYDTALAADEDANYNRRDFTPSSGTTAFLVRMRRTPALERAGQFGRHAERQFRWTDASFLVRPRFDDGPQRHQQQRVERFFRHHRPRHGHCRPAARQDCRTRVLDHGRHAHRPACSLCAAERSLGGSFRRHGRGHRHPSRSQGVVARADFVHHSNFDWSAACDHDRQQPPVKRAAIRAGLRRLRQPGSDDRWVCFQPVVL